MSSITIHIPADGLATIRCIFCGKVKQLSLARFRNSKHELATKCTCGKQFITKLNFRKHYRKPVTLFGQFNNLTSGTTGWTPAKILDLSMGGLRMKMEFMVEVQPGCTLRVRFKLDGPKAVALNKEVKVVFMEGNIIGCEFLDLALEEKDLGFYLLNS